MAIIYANLKIELVNLFQNILLQHNMYYEIVIVMFLYLEEHFSLLPNFLASYQDESLLGFFFE